MKVYNLCCHHQHRFEGWFASEADFSDQLARELIACPVCEDRRILRVPAAPRLNLGQGGGRGEGDIADLQRARLDAARKLVEGAEDVGERFVEEARRIHYREAPERSIRGLATQEEREALAEEGIEVHAISLPVSAKSTVQ